LQGLAREGVYLDLDGDLNLDDITFTGALGRCEVSDASTYYQTYD